MYVSYLFKFLEHEIQFAEQVQINVPREYNFDQDDDGILTYLDEQDELDQDDGQDEIVQGSSRDFINIIL